MDVLGEERVLQANLGRYNQDNDGFDNDALDFQQLEEFINNDISNINLPEDSAPDKMMAYNNGRGVEMPTVPRTTPSMSQASMHGTHPHQQHVGHLQHPGMPPMAHMASSHPQMYTPTSNIMSQQHMLKNPQLSQTQLPYSPPDSGSEPYSPPHGQQHAEPSSCNIKGSIVVGMTSTPQQLYVPQQGNQGHVSHPGQHGQGMPPHATTMSPPHAPHSSPPQHTSPHHQPNNSKASPSYPYQGEPPKLSHPPMVSAPPPQPLIPASLAQVTPQMLAQHFTSINNIVQHPNKKRKYSDSPNNTVTPGIMNGMGMNGMISHPHIKQEPGMLPEDDFTYDLTSEAGSMYLDSTYQVIKWQHYQPTKWNILLDANMKELPSPSYRVDADKGFNFSVPDDSFVCQKKNHFQVTVHIGITGDPKYVKTPEGTQKIDNFCVRFLGIKMESPGQHIKVEQSQSDRSKKAFHPVKVDVLPDQVTKVTVGRLHFSETTTNNMRKKGKPNPDQRYFMLVVALEAYTGDQQYMVAGHVSERIIVRASNPGQFDSDVDVLWQKGQTPESVFHAGRVGINTDRPDEPLTVHGNIKLTGHIIQPSDKRAKKDFEELDPKDQLKNVQQLKVYRYNYDDKFSDHAGLSEDEICDTGVIAQEVLEVLPDAVKETGDIVFPDGQKIENFLVVNKDRIYMENVGAVKELCKLTDNLENRIDELEKINVKLSKIKRVDSLKSTASTRSVSSCSTISRTASIPPKKADGSSSKNQTKPHRHHQHRHHHHHRDQGAHVKPGDDQGLCSNRFIQITVVVLVLVMAFCLVSITTLYIFERQKASNDPEDIVDEQTRVTANMTTLYASTIAPKGTPDRMSVPSGAIPLMPSRCRRMQCQPVCCDPGSLPLDDPPSVARASIMEEPPMAKASIKQDNNQNEVDFSNKTFPYQVHLDDRYGQGTASKADIRMVTPKQPSSSGSLEWDVQKGASESLIDTPPASALNSQRLEHDPKVQISDIITDMYGSRPRRSVDPDTAAESSPELKATMRIIQNNQSISLAYCADDQCRLGVGGNYSYNIPVSQYFPMDYATIEFSLASGLGLAHCHFHSHMTCSMDKAGNPDGQPHWHATHAGQWDWDLPVGYYFHSNFVFRVAPTDKLSDVCRIADQEVGNSFAEYNLYFSRMCGDQADDIS